MKYDFSGYDTVYHVAGIAHSDNGKISMARHINLIHEYAHLIQHQFGFGSQMFGEGFAELIPWYALEYESRMPSHFVSMCSMEKIYTANELLEKVVFSDRVDGQTCSFQQSYMSSYLWVRAVVEHIRKKFKLSRYGAVQKFLELYHNITFDKQWFVEELAEIIGMDAGKLLNSTEYQKSVLKQIKREL